MSGATWLDSLRLSKKKDDEVDDDDDDVAILNLDKTNLDETNSKKSTAKHKVWMDIIRKSSTNAGMKKYVDFMSYDADGDYLVCKCGGRAWQKERHKPSDINAHFGKLKHVNWLESVANVPKINSIAIKNKSLCSKLGDIVKEPLNYCYFRATFYCLYFIVQHNLSLTLLASFNALMSFFKITCTGVSYIWAYSEMITSFYHVRLDEIINLSHHAAIAGGVASENERDEADAVFLYSVLSTVHFWLYLCLILDVLTVIGMLSRYLQSDWIYAGNSKHTIEQSQILLHSKLSSASKPGHYVADFVEKVKNGELEKYGMTAEQLNTTTIHWLDHRMQEMWPLLKKEYEYRFPTDSQNVIQALYIFNIHRIKKIINKDDAFMDFGKEEIKLIAKSFHRQQRKIDTLQALDFGKEEIKLIAKSFHRQQRKIDTLQALNEWDAVKLEMKSAILSNPDVTNEQFWEPMMVEYDDKDTQCAHYLILLMYDASLRLKVNSADNERTFNTMNHTKTSQRNRMSDKVLDMLVFLNKSGWKCWHEIPMKKIVQYFLDHHDTKNDARGRTATFNQDISFKHAQQRQYDELKRLTELAKTAKRNKKTTVVSSASAIESEVDLTDSEKKTTVLIKNPQGYYGMEAGTVDPIKTHALVSRNLMGCDYDLVSECANLSQWIYETSGGQPPIPVSSAIERYDAICIDEGNYAIVRSHAHERDQDSLYVLFCGTKNIGHILSDLNANSSEVHDADANIIACVHAGMYDKARNKFWAIHKQIEQCLKNQAGIKNIIFTGHSLGGGVASLYVFESRLAKTAKRNKKTTVVSSASAIESEVDLTDSDSDWEEDDRPVMMQGDAVPEIFTALLPKNGAVTQTQCDGADFMCDHEW
eukprot:CAMPEP_0202729542 /NCGR_PEP_ID=MMETSP1385-20130828/186186_1 /ASSEMBLY_ACC=CAM_ASM_000861 /TAXON_ID=933848 /ORGANISM="Elphidium margaritaceum" /LENGTH=872 /DNA_ID=CAMNT_0049395807 /DNA_START=30 /DNA_END=2647 /DNA_ORIENTATION=+